MAGRKQRRSDKSRLTSLKKKNADSTNQWLADLSRDGVAKDELRRLAAEAASSGVKITKIQPGKRAAATKEAGWPNNNRASAIMKVFKPPKA